MKRVAIEITTTESCSYGCGQPAKYKNGSGRLMCSMRHNSCPALRAKNTAGLRLSYDQGRAKSDFGGKQNWAKGLSKDNDVRILNRSLMSLGKSKQGHPQTENSKALLRASRIKMILEGKHDTSGRKGHRGHYDGFYFHSTWELAFYVYEKEINNKIYTKNNSITIEYTFEDSTYVYVPDFVDETGNLFEIKGYLFSLRDNEKFQQTKDRVKYLFKIDITEHLAYCKQTYGKEFWKKLYG